MKNGIGLDKFQLSPVCWRQHSAPERNLEGSDKRKNRRLENLIPVGTLEEQQAAQLQTESCPSLKIKLPFADFVFFC